MNQVTPEQVLEALRNVKDPDLHQDIVTLGFITKNEVSDGSVQVTINLTTPACPVKEQMKGEAERLIRALPGVREVAIEMTAEVRGAAGPPREIAPSVRHFVASDFRKSFSESSLRTLTRSGSFRCQASLASTSFARSPPAASSCCQCWRSARIQVNAC